MSIYQVQKLIQTVNREQKSREEFLESRESLADKFVLTNTEYQAIVELDINTLYEMGVHPLLLRPFTIIHGVSEPDYLKAIREGIDSCP
jgi:hypothetical protein